MTFESGGYATWRCRVGHRLCCGCGDGSCAVTVVNGFWVDHDEFDGRLTRRLAHRLVVDAQVMPIRAVARRHLVSWAQVMTLLRAWSPLIAARRRSQRCEVLLVDETSMRKRHRYVTVIVNGDTGHTLAMVEHRSSAGLTGFLMSQPHSWRRSVKVVVSDGSKAYKASIQTCLPQARHVLDRFGVIRWFTAGLTAVCREIQRRDDGTKPVAGPQVFRARFLLMRRGDTLTDTDQARLDKLFDAHPRLKTGWQALQELHGLYLAENHDGALEALDRFGDLYKTGELPEFANIVDTIINWSDEILAWHHTRRPSIGRIEGIIICSASDGVVDVADAPVTACRGRVICSGVVNAAMLLLVCGRQCWGRFGSVRLRCRGGGL